MFSCVCSKTAIAIDTIINQKRFNEAEDESRSLVIFICTYSVLTLASSRHTQRKSCTVSTLPLVRRGVRWHRLWNDSLITVQWTLTRISWWALFGATILQGGGHELELSLCVIFHSCRFYEVHNCGECDCLRRSSPPVPLSLLRLCHGRILQRQRETRPHHLRWSLKAGRCALTAAFTPRRVITCEIVWSWCWTSFVFKQELAKSLFLKLLSLLFSLSCTYLCVSSSNKNLAEATFSAASVVAVVFLPLFCYS